MALLNGSMAPLTFGIGFVEAGLEDVSEYLRTDLITRLPQYWFTRWLNARLVKVASVSSCLPDALMSLEPLREVGPDRYLLLETRGSWTAVFDNCCGPATKNFAMSLAAHALQCRALAITCVPDTLSDRPPGSAGTWGAVQFELFSDDGTKGPLANSARAVSVIHEDRGQWRFDAAGDRLPFEQTGRYNATRIQDRLTEEMLVKYADALGIRLLDPLWYGPRGSLIAERYLIPVTGGLSLAQARATIGLD